MNGAIAKGAAWMVLFKLAERSLGLISTLVLARLLIPADFGLVAMAMSVIAIIELTSSFNFDIALIQRERPTKAQYDTAWTLNLGLGAACGLIIVALAYPAALFYSDQRLIAIMLVLGVSWAIQSFENIGTVDFRRNMNFSREFKYLASKKLIAFVVTIVLAIMLRSYWALIAGMVVGRLAGVVLSYTMQPYRPRFSLSASRELFSFSGWLLMNNILGVALARTSHFFIGRAHGADALGLFTIGAEIAYLPATELIAPINRAVFPGYARMASDPATLSRNFTYVIAVILLFALPASVGVAVVAEPLVKVLLGDQWLAAVPVIEIMALCGGIFAVTSNNVSAYYALGRTHLAPLILAVRLVALVPLLIILTRHFGLVGAAYAELIASVVSLVVSYPLLFRTLKVSVSDYFANLWRPLVAAALMGASVQMLVAELTDRPQALGAVWQLILAIPFGVFVYFLALLLLWMASGKPQGAETYLLGHMGTVLQRLRRTVPGARPGA